MEFTDIDIRNFWNKVDKSGDCWLWKGNSQYSYGRFKTSSGVRMHSHRFAYAIDLEIPSEYHIHHTCSNKLCVNPNHLSCVSPQEHIRLSGKHVANATHCKRGHELSGGNLQIRVRKDRAGGVERVCKECFKYRSRAAYGTGTLAAISGSS